MPSGLARAVRPAWWALMVAAIGLGCAPEAPVAAVPEPDLDADGYGASGDCDDGDATRSPGQTERCNDVDDDCDGQTDEPGAEGASLWYADMDGDGVGADDTVVLACSQPEGWLPTAGDCDDLRAEIGPGMPERCDGLDQDCDGEVDEPGAPDGMPAYRDLDQDGAGDPDLSNIVCAFDADWVSNRLDCDDTNPKVWTGNAEICDDLDNDCDGEVDEDPLDGDLLYRDADGDHAGDPDVVGRQCGSAAGWSSVAGDCDDTRADVEPGDDEVCDGVDNDCDGEIDGTCNLGRVRWVVGSAATRGVYACDLAWDATWSPSAVTCDDCLWAFDVALSYVADESDNSGDCVDEADADLSWTLLLTRDESYHWGLSRLEEDETRTPFDAVTFNSATGRISFVSGGYDVRRDGLYETDAWTGEAELYELTR